MRRCNITAKGLRFLELYDNLGKVMKEKEEDDVMLFSIRESY
jgi:hypothetical protein